jgi:hypothetical protein
MDCALIGFRYTCSYFDSKYLIVILSRVKKVRLNRQTPFLTY